MRAIRNNSGRVLAIALAAAMLAGCASRIAPQGWLDSPRENQRQAFGGWVRLETIESDFETPEGELIAVQPDSIFLLGISGHLEGYPASQVRKVHVQAYDPKLGTITFWTIAGSASTISHGFVLVISLPVWIITGTISGAVVSAAAHEKTAPQVWSDLNRFARFPQGLPPGMDRSKLRPKPFD